VNIPFINRGEVVPLGLSKHAAGHCLQFPVWARRRRGYDPVRDEFVSGRWVFEVAIRTELSGISLRWGWTRRAQAAA
jgi:hypothetical protein